jgi:uncharacterized membrane protein YgdD (TMEM256/DUF423 family)
MNRLLLVIAGPLGAAGVAAAAAAAHVAGDGPLASAAQVMMIHAAALVGLTALAAPGRRGARPIRVIGTAMGLAAGLFGADVTLFALTGGHLFRWAAPIGGTTLILAWSALALAAAFGAVGRDEG